MDQGNRPVGREERVGSGLGKVFRRGEGLGGQTGGPVGEGSGYSDRPEAPPPSPSDESRREAGAPSGGYGPGGGASGGGPLRPGGGPIRPGGLGCSPKLLVILLAIVIIVAVVAYLASRAGGGAGTSVDSGGTVAGGGTTASAPTTSPGGGAGLGSETSSPVTSLSQQARAKRTLIKGNGNDSVTVMVYLCATDLESKGGMATADLNEMLKADTSDKLNVIVETGGTSRWRNNVISNSTNQRYRVTAKGLELVRDNVGRTSMVDPATLSDFIRFSKSHYPADRYELVLWDHGGGSLTGYGYDERFPNGSMTLDELATGLKDGGCVFDMIGFDACLMGALETAAVLEPYADYVVGSEETEPGIGWYYTGWLSALAGNTSIPTTDLGKRLIDDYVSECRSQTPESQATLALVDLAEFKGMVPSAFASFASSTSGLIDKQQYETVSNARADAKEFASSSQLNQVDLIDFAQKLGTPEAGALVTALRGCIKYNRTTANITNANGISIFFPYERLRELSSMLATYDRIGISSEYSQCVRSFASVAAGGQVTSTGGGGLLDVLLGGAGGGSGPSVGGTVASLLESFLSKGDYSSITGQTGGGAGWLDTDRMRSYESYYEGKRFDTSALTIATKNGQRVIALPEAQWGLVQDLAQNVFIDDGKGFIDLGLDNVFSYNADGDLVMEYDGTWLALNGQIVGYYLMSDDRSGDSYSIKGRVPAMLNGEPVDIILVFDNDHPDGVVLGAQPKYDTATETGTGTATVAAGTATVAKGLLDIVSGDKIDYLCDYYTYAGQYSNTYYLGDQYVATGQWTVANLSVGNLGYQMTYRLTDIYGNQYWTPSVRGK
jgi:hypothetical protein